MLRSISEKLSRYRFTREVAGAFKGFAGRFMRSELQSEPVALQANVKF